MRHLPRSYHLSFGLPGFGYSAKMELLPVGWSEMARARAAQARGAGITQTPTVVVGMNHNFIASEAHFTRGSGGGSPATTGSHLGRAA
jgi:hypothetical protein